VKSGMQTYARGEKSLAKISTPCFDKEIRGGKIPDE
jgi:hypothetical protein